MTGLTPGATYFFRFRPLTKAGEGDWSHILDFIVKQAVERTKGGGGQSLARGGLPRTPFPSLRPPFGVGGRVVGAAQRQVRPDERLVRPDERLVRLDERLLALDGFASARALPQVIRPQQVVSFEFAVFPV